MPNRVVGAKVGSSMDLGSKVLQGGTLEGLGESQMSLPPCSGCFELLLISCKRLIGGGRQKLVYSIHPLNSPLPPNRIAADSL